MKKLSSGVFLKNFEKLLKILKGYGSYFAPGIGEYMTYMHFEKAKKITYDYMLDEKSFITVNSKSYKSMSELIQLKDIKIATIALGTMKGLGYWFLLYGILSSSPLTLFFPVSVGTPSLYEIGLDNKMKGVISNNKRDSH